MDELNKSVSKISLLVEKIKHNHNVILASVQNNEAKDETNDLMSQIKKLSQRVHGGLKREYSFDSRASCQVLLCFLGLRTELEEEEKGPNRNTADFRIKKAQVCCYILLHADYGVQLCVINV